MHQVFQRTLSTQTNNNSLPEWVGQKKVACFAVYQVNHSNGHTKSDSSPKRNSIGSETNIIAIRSSSSREVRIRVPTFSVYFSRGTESPPKRNGTRAPSWGTYFPLGSPSRAARFGWTGVLLHQRLQLHRAGGELLLDLKTSQIWICAFWGHVLNKYGHGSKARTPSEHLHPQ